MTTEPLRGFYAIVDMKEAPVGDGAALVAYTERLLAAAPCALQLRAKGLPAAVVRAAAARILPACHAARVPFCVNDRVDVALAVGADMVHVGQEDLPLEAVLRLVRAPDGPAMIVGVSTHDPTQAARAAEGGADYIGFGPVFGTTTKVNPDPVVGLDMLSEIVRAVSIPVVAIGGITRENVGAVAATGASAAAVISDIERAEDPTAAGRLIAAAFADAPAKAASPRRRGRRARAV